MSEILFFKLIILDYLVLNELYIVLYIFSEHEYMESVFTLS